MITGIVIPTELEASLIIEGLGGAFTTIQRKRFYQGALAEDTVVVLCICGIGKANAAHGTTLLIEYHSPDLVCTLGVAGAYPSSGLVVGDLAVAEREIYGDEGLLLSDGLKTMESLDLPLFVDGIREFYNEFPLIIPEPFGAVAKKGNFVTLSGCTGTMSRAREIEQRFGAVCETMEGATVAHVCRINGIPACEVRGISNVIEDREARPLSRPDIVAAALKVQEFFLSCAHLL
ncbi:MAG TPA: futalosine hydrolase [Dissulfurispiraceae bacterium]|nr:futalosine hydrolase [Dissulfurispiraceae bacterium]